MVEAATTTEQTTEQVTSAEGSPATGQVDNGSSREILMQGGTNDQTEAPLFELPENLRDNQLFSGIDSWDAVEQKIANLDALRGKKGIPEQNTPEAWQRFIDELGEGKEVLQDLMQIKHEAPEKYEFSDIEGYNDEGATDEFFNEIFKEHNIQQDVADSIRKKTIENFLEIDKAEKTRLGKEFEAMATAEWGDQWEQEIAEATVEFQKVFTEDQRKLMETVPNEILMPMLKYIKDNQIRMQNFNGVIGMQGQANGMADDQVMAKFKELSANKHQGGRALKDFNDFRNANRDQLAKLFRLDNN